MLGAWPAKCTGGPMPRDLSKETLGTLWAPTRVLDLWKKIRSALLFWRRRNISFFFFFSFFLCVCVIKEIFKRMAEKLVYGNSLASV